MKLIICVDNSGGMMFNQRRQSRDRMLVEDVIHSLNGEKLYIFDFSEILFEDTEAVIISEEKVKEIGDGWLFLEKGSVAALAEYAESLTVYCWNRDYPSDFKCDFDYKNKMKLESTCEFKGNSHEKITKEVYTR